MYKSKEDSFNFSRTMARYFEHCPITENRRDLIQMSET